MPRTRVGDIEMYYEVHGEGEPLVLINGAGAGVEWFYRLIPVYSGHYRLVLFDNRGAGRSDRPGGAYTTELMSDDLAGLLDVIGIDTAHVKGVSMGGMVAQQFALRHPMRVRSLVLVTTTCGGPHGIRPPVSEMLDLHRLSPREAAESVLRWSVTEGFVDRHSDFFQKLVDFAMKHPIIHTDSLRHFQAIEHHDTYDRLPEIGMPTLVIGAGADRIIDVENARILASRISHAELVIFKEAGHALVEAGDEVDRVCLDFLRRHRVRG